MPTHARVLEVLEALGQEPDPYYLTVQKNLSDAYKVYLNASTNLDTILEDSINKLTSPPPQPPQTWWHKMTRT